jgi:hypothetical protein
MRHTTHFTVTENLPHCDNCGASLVYTRTVDLSKDGRVYLIFRCTECDAGERMVWRTEWQALADSLVAEE